MLVPLLPPAPLLEEAELELALLTFDDDPIVETAAMSINPVCLARLGLSFPTPTMPPERVSFMPLPDESLGVGGDCFGRLRFFGGGIDDDDEDVPPSKVFSAMVISETAEDGCF